MELQKELTLITSLELPATFVFDYPTIAEMSTFILESLPAEKSQASKSQASQLAAERPDIARVLNPLVVMDTAGRKEYVESQVKSELTTCHEPPSMFCCICRLLKSTSGSKKPLNWHNPGQWQYKETFVLLNGL